MMKYRVTFSCNHTDLIDINGTANQIRQRIEYLTTEGLCPVCYGHKQNAVMAIGCHEEEMFYGRYKNEYSDCNFSLINMILLNLKNMSLNVVYFCVTVAFEESNSHT